jgi:hypothetical protein
LPIPRHASSDISGLSEKDFLSILNKKEVRLSLLVGGLIDRQCDKLAQRQTSSSLSIKLWKPEVVDFGGNYVAYVRETTAEFAATLAEAVGRHKDLGWRQLRWVLKKVLEFYQDKKSVEAGKTLFDKAFADFLPVNAEEAGGWLTERVTRSKTWSGLPQSAKENVRHEFSVYGGATKVAAQLAAPAKAAVEASADRDVNAGSALPIEPKAKRGPKPKMKFHRTVTEVVGSFGPKWKQHLERIAAKLDKLKIPAPQAWATRERRALTWTRAVEYYPAVVVKVLEYSLKMAAKGTAEKPSETLANLR